MYHWNKEIQHISQTTHNSDITLKGTKKNHIIVLCRICIRNVWTSKANHVHKIVKRHLKNMYTKFTLLFDTWLKFFLIFHALPCYHSTVGYATMNDPTMNECYNEQFLSIKSGCCNKHKYYNKHGGILSVEVARACAWRVRPSRFD